MRLECCESKNYAKSCKLVICPIVHGIDMLNVPRTPNSEMLSLPYLGAWYLGT